MATVSTFLYEAQTAQGQTLSGTIDAPSIEQASNQLQALQLRVTRIEPSATPAQSKAFRGDDFVAFNQQLAQLTAAGIPMERGLRLIASDIGSRRQAAAVNRIAAELEKGATLEAAFAGHKGDFPPLYGKLMEAGVRAGNLPGMLLSIGRHVEMIQRLRAAIWRAGSYPLMVLIALLAVMGFIWGWIIPHMSDLRYHDPALEFLVNYRKPAGSAFPNFDLLPIAMVVSYVLMGLIALVLLSVVVLWLLGRTRRGAELVERLVIPLPLVGPILRWNLLARWCDALQLGVQAGLDLPAAIDIANDAVGSQALQADSRQMVQKVKSGTAMDSGAEYYFLPAIIPAALQLGAQQNNLPATVATLAKMYQEQAEVRLNVLPTALSPIMLLMITVCVGLAVAAALMPMVRLIQNLTQ